MKYLERQEKCKIKIKIWRKGYVMNNVRNHEKFREDNKNENQH